MKSYILTLILLFFGASYSYSQCTAYGGQNSSQTDPGCGGVRTYNNVAFTQRVEITGLDAGDRYRFEMSNGTITSRMDVFGPGNPGTQIYNDPSNGSTASYTRLATGSGNYYVYVRNSTCAWVAQSHTIRIRQIAHDGGNKPSITYNCSNTVLSASGGTGSYQWQGSNNGSTWTDIGGATFSTYTITAATTPQYQFYRVRRGQNCFGFSPSSDPVLPRGNYGGGDLVISSNIVLAGTFNLGANDFTVNSGVTVTVANACILEVIADNITINGTIDGNGRGASGGGGGSAGALWSGGSFSGAGITSCTDKDNCRELRLYGGNGGANGGGTAGGTAGATAAFVSGQKQYCRTVNDYGGLIEGSGGGGGAEGGGYGGSAGAGGNGGIGGNEAGCRVDCGSTDNRSSGGSGGDGGTDTYGSATGFGINFGSGGGGAGGGGRGPVSQTNGSAGGAGGGGVSLQATCDLTLSSSARILMNGSNGGAGGRGGNSFETSECCNDLTGGCDEVTYSGAGGGGGGAGGGSGGGILLASEGDMTLAGGSILEARGGNGGAGGSKGFGDYFDDAGSGAAGGGGGGGRIKIFVNPCGTNTNSATVSVAAGTGAANGGAGTYNTNLTIPGYSALTAGSIGSNQTICFNTEPSALTQVSAANGGKPSSCGSGYVYEWFSTTSNCGFNFSSYTSASAPAGYTALGVNSTTLSGASIGNLTQTTCFVRRVQSGNCYRWTSVVTVTVRPDFNPGTIASGNQTICPLGDPNNITMSSSPSGAYGAFSYQWYYRNGSVSCPTGTSTAGWTAIGGATSSSYNPPSGLTTTRTYAVQVNATTPASPPGLPDCSGVEWASNCRVVTVQDNTNPTITCPGNQTLAANGSCQATLPNYTGSAITSDNCSPPGTVTVTQSPAPGSTVGFGTTSVTLTANDGNGNTASCSFNVEVEDNTAPSVTCSNISINLNALGNASITPADVYASGSDNCGTVNLVSVTPNTFDCSDIGANTVTLTVNDGNGNTNTCTATVTVQDNTNPSAVCQNFTLVLDGSGNGTLTTANIDNGSADACGIQSLSLSKTAFTCADVGANTVTLTVTDNNSNTNTCTATVTVQEAPPTPASAGNDDFICRDEDLTLSGNNPVVGTGTWTWTGPGIVTYNSGNANTHNANVSFSAEGTYTGTWTIQSNCSSSADQVVIGVNLPGNIVMSDATGTCESNQVNDWVHLFNANGNIIASVRDNNQNLGFVTASVYYHGGNAFSVPANNGQCPGYWQAVLNRSFVINSTIAPSSDIDIRLYFTDAELADLISHAGCLDPNGCEDDDDVCSINGLYVTQIDGAAAEDGVFTLGDGTFTLHSPSNNGTGNATFGANYVQLSVDGFSEFWIHGSETGVVLPVELLNFTALAVDNTYIRLDWATATEINNEGFEVQRSTDGVNFEPIAFVEGNGNTSTVQNYSYKDAAVVKGQTYYYQLKQIDFDGGFEYFDIKSARLDKENEGIEISGFIPNPAEDESVLRFSVTKEVRVMVSLYDITGKLVLSQEANLGNGENTIPFNTRELAAGTYNAKIIIGSDVYSRRLMINK